MNFDDSTGRSVGRWSRWHQYIHCVRLLLMCEATTRLFLCDNVFLQNVRWTICVSLKLYFLRNWEMERKQKREKRKQQHRKSVNLLWVSISVVSETLRFAFASNSIESLEKPSEFLSILNRFLQSYDFFPLGFAPWYLGASISVYPYYPQHKRWHIFITIICQLQFNLYILSGCVTWHWYTCNNK